MIAKIGNEHIIETHSVKLLGLTIDSDLNFEKHMDLICSKASKKLNALSRQCAILPFNRRKMLMNAFFVSQFSYCPLIWMFHNRSINERINKLHYRALRMVYQNDSASFDELLLKNGSVKVHQQNLQSLCIEMFKVRNGLAPSFMQDIFSTNKNVAGGNISSNTRAQSQFYNYSNPKKVNTGLETLRCLGPKIWDKVPRDIRNAASLSIFTNKIRKQTFSNCPCRLCKRYVPNLGYI